MGRWRITIWFVGFIFFEEYIIHVTWLDYMNHNSHSTFHIMPSNVIAGYLSINLAVISILLINSHILNSDSIDSFKYLFKGDLNNIITSIVCLVLELFSIARRHAEYIELSTYPDIYNISELFYYINIIIVCLILLQLLINIINFHNIKFNIG